MLIDPMRIPASSLQPCFLIQPLRTLSNHSHSPSLSPLYKLFDPTLSLPITTYPPPRRRRPTCSASSPIYHNKPSPSSEQVSIQKILLAAGISTLLLLATQTPVNAYGLIHGRLESCKGDTSCISTTSVANPSKFGAPWTFEPQTSDPSEAWASLKAVINKNSDGGVIVESLDGPKVFYLRAEFPVSGVSKVFNKDNVDDLEFRMIPEERLMTYRCASREAFYLYPLQRPIEMGTNKARLEEIRQQLGWVELVGEELY